MSPLCFQISQVSFTVLVNVSIWSLSFTKTLIPLINCPFGLQERWHWYGEDLRKAELVRFPNETWSCTDMGITIQIEWCHVPTSKDYLKFVLSFELVVAKQSEVSINQTPSMQEYAITVKSLSPPDVKKKKKKKFSILCLSFQQRDTWWQNRSDRAGCFPLKISSEKTEYSSIETSFKILALCCNIENIYRIQNELTFKWINIKINFNFNKLWTWYSIFEHYMKEFHLGLTLFHYNPKSITFLARWKVKFIVLIAYYL